MDRRTDPETWSQLRAGVWADGAHWAEAVKVALARGWSEADCGRVLFWWHPATWVMFVALAACVAVGIARLAGLE